MGFGFDHLVDEMADAELGDARLSRRLALIAEAVAKRPGKSLPKALVSDAALEATYRFMSNDAVTPARILAPHIAATSERAEEAGCVLAIHDTTECEFKGDPREGLGRLSERRQGFHAHVCLAAKADDGQPLGLLGVHTWVRPHEVPGRKKRSTYEHKTRAAKESDRWGEVAARVEIATAGRARVIHVMDREADFYRLEAQLVDAGADFVIRGSHLDRKLANGRKLEEETDGLRIRLTRDVALSKRAPPPRNATRKTAHPPRSARSAELVVGTTTVTLKRSWAVPKAEGPEFDLNVVHVWEPNPPADEAAIEWTLLTTLPTATADDLRFVVDVYRRRWLIEELFKALKSGCQFEKLQLESAAALLNAFAVMLPVAVGLLALRDAARMRPDTLAEDVLTPLQIKVLRVYEHTRKLPLKTARDAMFAVARLGGHIKNNGDPGWIVLGRGYEDLLTLEAGARMAREM
jgi:IS4 transposase